MYNQHPINPSRKLIVRSAVLPFVPALGPRAFITSVKLGGNRSKRPVAYACAATE